MKSTAGVHGHKPTTLMNCSPRVDGVRLEGDDARVPRLSRLNATGLAILTSGAGMLAVVFGFAIVPDGFLGNVLAEAGGLAASVAVALLLVDRVSAQERRKQ